MLLAGKLNSADNISALWLIRRSSVITRENDEKIHYASRVTATTSARSGIYDSRQEKQDRQAINDSTERADRIADDK